MYFINNGGKKLKYKYKNRAIKLKYSYKVKCSLIDTESKVTNNHGPKQDGPNRDGPECRAQMGQMERAQMDIQVGPNGMGRIGM